MSAQEAETASKRKIKEREIRRIRDRMVILKMILLAKGGNRRFEIADFHLPTDRSAPHLRPHPIDNRKSPIENLSLMRSVTNTKSGTYAAPFTNLVAFLRHFTYNYAAFDFRVPSQYMNLRLTQRVTCLQKTRKFQRYINTKEQRITWKQEQ